MKKIIISGFFLKHLQVAFLCSVCVCACVLYMYAHCTWPYNYIIVP